MIELIFWIPAFAGMTVRAVNWISYRIELTPSGRTQLRVVARSDSDEAIPSVHWRVKLGGLLS